MTEEQRKLSWYEIGERLWKTLLEQGVVQDTGDGDYWLNTYGLICGECSEFLEEYEVAAVRRGRIAELENAIQMFEKEIRPDEDDSLLDEVHDSGIGECIQRVRFRLAELKEDTP